MNGKLCGEKRRMDRTEKMEIEDYEGRTTVVEGRRGIEKRSVKINDCQTGCSAQPNPINFYEN